MIAASTYPLSKQCYQLTRITAERGALTNDDRLDSLAMAGQYWVDAMAQNVEVHMGTRCEELMIAELDRLSPSVDGLAVITGHQEQRATLRW